MVIDMRGHFRMECLRVKELTFGLMEQIRQGRFFEGKIIEAADKRENDLLKKDSPWETWDGIVERDFQLWLQLIRMYLRNGRRIIEKRIIIYHYITMKFVLFIRNCRIPN